MTKLKKNKNIVAILAIFFVILVLNFSIKNVPSADDQWFLNIFQNKYNNNYLKFGIDRFHNWTSRFIIESVLVSFVKNINLWRIVNSIAMLIVIVIPPYLFKTNNRFRGLIVSFLFTLLIPIAAINNAGWVATTTNYVWVMAAALIAIFPIFELLNGDKKKYWFLEYMLGIVFLVYASNQEQMIVILLVVLTLIAFYMFFKKKKDIIYIVPYHLIVILNLLIALSSQGNKIRAKVETQNWLPDFINYTVGDKILLGYITTFSRLFIQYSSIVFMFLTLLFLLGFQKNISNLKKFITSLPILIYIISIVVFIKNNINFDVKLNNYISLIVFLTFFIIIITISIMIVSESHLSFLIVMAMLALGCGSRIMMGFSPTIFASGERTFYFTYIFIIMSSIYLLKDIKFKDLKIWNFYLFLLTIMPFLPLVKYLIRLL